MRRDNSAVASSIQLPAPSSTEHSAPIALIFPPTSHLLCESLCFSHGAGFQGSVIALLLAMLKFKRLIKRANDGKSESCYGAMLDVTFDV